MSPAEQSGPPQDVERGRLQMEREWQLRQENVLPLETAWNEGNFYGRVLKGRQLLTGVQRVGIFMIGIQAIGVAGLMLFLSWPFPEFAPFLSLVMNDFPAFHSCGCPFCSWQSCSGFDYVG